MECWRVEVTAFKGQCLVALTLLVERYVSPLDAVDRRLKLHSWVEVAYCTGWWLITVSLPACERTCGIAIASLETWEGPAGTSRSAQGPRANGSVIAG